MTNERDRALMEGHRNAASAAYIAARPALDCFPGIRRTYDAAYAKGWDDRAALSQPSPAAPVAHRSTGYVAPKGRYVPPVLFSPYTGEPRDARDIRSDPQGVLIVPPGADLAAYKGR